MRTHKESGCHVVYLDAKPESPEPAEYIVKFPGGSIAVCRIDDQDSPIGVSFWAHVEINHVDNLKPTEREGALIHARIDRLNHHAGTEDLGSFSDEDTYHVAFRIQPGASVFNP